MLNKLLKKYDKYLGYKKNLDGSVLIFRQSPYTTNKYEILSIENQYLGSYKWLMRKIILMDSNRIDFITDSINKNKKLRQNKKDKRISKEVAEFILNSGMTLVN